MGFQEWHDGTRYFGEWKDNKANGKGQIDYADKDTYCGEWVDNRCHGYGIYVHETTV